MRDSSGTYSILVQYVPTVVRRRIAYLYGTVLGTATGIRLRYTSTATCILFPVQVQYLYRENKYYVNYPYDTEYRYAYRYIQVVSQSAYR